MTSEVKKVYIVLEDHDGTMRSSCDQVTGAFKSKEAAEKFIIKSKDIRSPYSSEIQETELSEDE